MADFTFCDPHDDAAFPVAHVPDEVIAVFDEYEMSVNALDTWCGMYRFELEGHTNAGGDMLHTIEVIREQVSDPKAWYQAFDEVYECFDPWEEAFNWCDQWGRPVRTPFMRGADLFHDIEDYDSDTLKKVDEELYKLAFGR